MNARKSIILIGLLTLLGILASACAPAAAPTPAQSPVGARAMQDSAGRAAPAAAPAQPTMAPAPAEAPAAASAAAGQLPPTGVNASPQRATRMIIKNGEMSLLVTDTDRAIDQVTGVAVDTGGYIISSKTWLQDGFKYASLTMGVPSDQFEVAQRRLRSLALEVQNDTASGQDVSQEYVDLQSRLTNLEATAARIRDFLAKATKVEEALQVNQQLSDVENQIEQVKGRMQFLNDRSAFSTLAVTLNPQVPTPTPTPTPTPVAWQPGKTIAAAGDTLGGMLRGLVDAVIWVSIVLLPFAIPVLVLVALVVYFRRRNKKTALKSLPSTSVTEAEKPGA